VQRISKFLLSEDVDQSAIQRSEKPILVTDPDEQVAVPSSVAIAKATFSWGDRPVLNDISLHVPTGSLCIIVGPVGSGKTSLLSALVC